MANRVLYWGSGSSPCWRVMVGLSEKSLKYDSKLLEFSKKEHKSPEILAMNPRGQLPTLVDGDKVLKESLATLVYLEETYPEPAMLPKDPSARTVVWQRLFEAGNLREKALEAFKMRMQDLVKTEEDEKVFSEKLEPVKAELALWESYLKASGGPFLTGPDFTLADAAFAPDLMSFKRYGAKFEGYPALRAYAEAIEKRPSVADNVPPHWKETAGKDWLAAL